MPSLRKIIKKLIPKSLFKKIEPIGHLAEAVLANLIFNFPARKLKIIGVTGTNGKTTVATLVYELLKGAGCKTGLMTTVSIDTGDGLKPNVTRLTTISAWDLFKNIKKIKHNGMDWLILETTSHGLAQHRIWGIPFYLGIFTNLTHEHLDYHETLENYKQAKIKLFRLVAKNPLGLRTGIYNADDLVGKEFANVVPKAIGYGIEQGEIRAINIEDKVDGSIFDVNYHDRNLKVNLCLPGRFNISNALAAVGVGFVVGLSNQQIETGIKNFEGLEGRMNHIEMGQNFNVIVDYAHTPDSFEKIFAEMKPLVKGRMIVVFGSAGERDHAKRTIQGELAGKWCDLVIVTEEDDRIENGQTILAEIAAGAKQAGKIEDKDLFLIHDRTIAIQKAIMLAQKDDVVLLLGKGHEKSILHNNQKIPWNETETAKSAIRTKLKGVA